VWGVFQRRSRRKTPNLIFFEIASSNSTEVQDRSLSEHPEYMGVYYFVEGEGVMVVDGERYDVSPGSIVVASQGAVRGVEALTRLVYVATRVK
jgi:mannose-6-phosphate isomerase-like protein (cupin superfamily)